MTIPGFTAGSALPQSGREETRPWAISGSGRVDVSRGITPAARDPKQQAYSECLADCRAEGGASQACRTQCTAEVFPPVGHGTGPGTSDLQAACCLATFAACMVSAWGNFFGMAGCMFAATQCTTSGPCSGL
jgi:hypothetical protein